MNVRRYFAADMREALKLVQADLGPEAVVLENRKVVGGVELVATLDHEQALHEHELRQRARHRQVKQAEDPHLLPAWVREEGVDQPEDISLPSRFVEAVIAAPKAGGRDQQLAGLSQHLQDKGQPPRQNDDMAALKAELELLRTQLRDIQQMQSGGHGPGWGRLRARLQRVGLGDELIEPWLSSMPASHLHDEDKAWQACLGRLAKSLRMDTETELVDRQGVVVLLGPTGAGKTTTLAKLAARHVIRHGSRGLVLLSTDSYRVGSYEQLQKIAKALGVSSSLVEPGDNLDRVIAALGPRRLVLMDTAGFSRQAPEQMAQQRLLAESRYRLLGQLVLPANLQGAVLKRNYEDFSGFNLTGAIISKTDEATSLGETLSLLAMTSLPVSYITNGQRIPEDIAVPRAAQLVSQAVALVRHMAKPATRTPAKVTGRMVNSSHN